MKPLVLPAVLCALVLATPPGAIAEDFASAPMAAEVVKLLQTKGIDSMSAVDPSETDRFVAALYIPGSQLLVVSAIHPSAFAVKQRIDSGAHRDVYLDLQATPTSEGKFFVMDAQADGLLNAQPDSGGVDIVYEDEVTTYIFNGDPQGQDLSEEAYDKAYASADLRYAQALTVLRNALSR